MDHRSKGMEVEAHRQHASTLAFMSFFTLGGFLYWLGTFLPANSQGIYVFLELIHYLACFFAIFAVGPFTHYYLRRLTRHMDKD